MAIFFRDLKSESETTTSSSPGSFGLKVLQGLSEKNRSKNLLFSPLIMQLSFALPYKCSCDATSAELRGLFDFMSVKPQDIAEAHNQLMSEALDPDVTAETLIIVDSQTSMNGDFLRTCKQFNKLQVRMMNYKNANAVRKIFTSMLNKRWSKSPNKAALSFVSYVDSSEDVIVDHNRSTIDYKAPLQTESIMVINTVHLRAKIESELFATDSTSRTFYRNDEEQFDIEFMRGCSVLQIFKSRQLKANVIEIPLMNKNNYFMYIILPFTTNGIWHTEVALYDVNFALQIEQLRPYLVDISMPKFSMNCMIRLKEVLQANGVEKIFDKETNHLPGVANSPICVDAVYQKCGIDFVGVAVKNRSEAEIKSGSSHTSYKDKRNRDLYQTKEIIVVDHPFLFVIRKNDMSDEKVRNLFVGKFINAL